MKDLSKDNATEFGTFEVLSLKECVIWLSVERSVCIGECVCLASASNFCD